MDASLSGYESEALRPYLLEICRNLQTAVLLVRGDKIFYANRAACTLFERGEEKLVDQSLLDVLEAIRPLTAEEKDHKRAVRSKVFNEGHAWFQWIFKFDDKNNILVEVEGTRLDDDKNREDTVIMYQIRDITQEHENEKELLKMNAYFRAVIDNIPFDFWVNNRENRTMIQNRVSKGLWGQAKGKHYSEIIPDEETLKRWKRTNEAAMQGKLIDEEVTLHADQGMKIFRNIVAPVFQGREIIGIMGLNIDISHYRFTERKLATALRERETLIREIHHRVKNNLQLINSLVNLQRYSLADIREDEDALLTDIENRINALALIHEELYGEGSFVEISFDSYLEKIVASIKAAFLETPGRGALGEAEQRQVSVNIDSEPVMLNLDQAIPLGIICNELLSNSLKHAFPQKGGNVDIVFQHSGGEYHLNVCDNGPGLPQDDARELKPGLGLTLVEQLAAQLKGRLEYKRESGFSVSLDFPADL